MRKIFLILLLCWISEANAQIFNDYPSSYQYAGVAAKNAFLLPADTVLTTAANVDKCRQLAKVHGVIYSYSCELGKWTPVGQSTVYNLQQVTAAGNVTNTDINIEGPGKKFTIYSPTGVDGAQIQLFDASGSTAFLQAFKGGVPAKSWSQLVLQGEVNKIVTSNNLVFITDNAKQYLTLNTDGRVTGSPGINQNDFATVSQLASAGGISNQSGSAQSANFWISGTGNASKVNLLSPASSSYVPRISLSTGSTLSSTQRFAIGLQGNEVGSNFGNNFYISSYSDAGAVLDENAFTIERTSGSVGIGKMADAGSGMRLDVAGPIRASDAYLSSVTTNGIVMIGGSVYLPVRTVNSGAVSLSGSLDHVVLCNSASGAINLYLPNPQSYPYLTMIVRKISTDTNTITLSSNSAKVEGVTDYVIPSNQKSVGLINDGVNWFIITN